MLHAELVNSILVVVQRAHGAVVVWRLRRIHAVVGTAADILLPVLDVTSPLHGHLELVCDSLHEGGHCMCLVAAFDLVQLPVARLLAPAL